MLMESEIEGCLVSWTSGLKITALRSVCVCVDDDWQSVAFVDSPGCSACGGANRQIPAELAGQATAGPSPTCRLNLNVTTVVAFKTLHFFSSRLVRWIFFLPLVLACFGNFYKVFFFFFLCFQSLFLVFSAMLAVNMKIRSFPFISASWNGTCSFPPPPLHPH